MVVYPVLKSGNLGVAEWKYEIKGFYSVSGLSTVNCDLSPARREAYSPDLLCPGLGVRFVFDAIKKHYNLNPYRLTQTWTKVLRSKRKKIYITLH